MTPEELTRRRAEVEAHLDRSRFQPHPDGYICRCGLLDHCVCVWDWPELVIAEQGETIRELRRRLEQR